MKISQQKIEKALKGANLSKSKSYTTQVKGYKNLPYEKLEANQFYIPVEVK